MQPNLNKAELVQELKTLGVLEGDHLAVAMALKSVGKVEGGAATFVEALLEAVGPGGTVMMNTFTPDFALSEIKVQNYIYHRKTSPSTTGIVSEVLRNHPAAVRSFHPSISVSAIGYHADTLTRDHDEKAPLYQPYSTLAEINGKRHIFSHPAQGAHEKI
ncbi:MAG: AAC(3) family N-acetyltransferase [Deltaproteobacteria bacterium]|nr:AAC(3) family N-acetyltransferase [Deltaproteobacteria bacterium]